VAHVDRNNYYPLFSITNITKLALAIVFSNERIVGLSRNVQFRFQQHIAIKMLSLEFSVGI
jgi:hypothetical protein